MTTEKIEFPAVVRDLAARAIKSVQARAESLNVSAEKTTAQIETGVSTVASTLADASRNLQGAIHEDVTAALGAVEKIASAKSLAEAAQIHVQYLGDRAQVGLTRMTKAADYLAKALRDGAKSAEDAIGKMGAKAA